MLRKIITDCFTERDNQTFDPVRILGTFGYFSFIGMGFYELIHHCRDFQLLELSGGIAMILGIFAGGVVVKSKTEKN